MTNPNLRNYAVNARSTDIHGRVLCNVRNHHFIVDVPVQNGAPGEAVTPAELFLTGIAACGIVIGDTYARAGRDRDIFDSAVVRPVVVSELAVVDSANDTTRAIL